MTAKNKKKDGGGDAKARNGGKNGKVNGKEQGKLLKDEKKQIRQRRDSEDSQVSFESVEDYIPTPPDGGWGWVIVCSSVFCNLIVDGIGYSFGVFLQEFVEYFKEPKSKVSLVGSLLCGTYLFAGPIVSGMTNKFGCRPVIIAGSLIATVAFILACFSTSLVMLIITYGVIGGFGLGMIYLPAIVSVGYYFEKKRAFATGIAVAGSGLGTFIFPPLSEFLINELTWQGGLLIIAGIILNGCLCGALMRPLKPQKPKPRDKPRSKTLLDRIKENTHRERTVSELGDTTTILQGVMQAKLNREKNLQDNDSDLGSLPSLAFVNQTDGTSDHRRYSAAITIAPDPSNQKLSVSSAGDSAVTSSPARDVASSPGSQVTPRVQSPSSGQESEKEDYRDGKISPDPESEAKISEVAESVATGASDYFTPPVSPSTTTPNSPVHEASSSGSSPVKSVQEDPKEELQKKSTHRQQSNGAVPASDFAPLLEVPAPVFKPSGSKTGSYGGSRTSMLHIHSINSLHVSKKDLSRPMYRKDIFYSGSVLNIPEYKSQTDIRSFITSITTIPGEMEFVDGPSPSSRCINSLCSFLPRSVRDILSEMVDISLFKDISFMLICLGNITAFLGFYIPFMFLVDRAVLLDVDKSNAAFLISIIGITNTVGRVIVGKLADLHIIDSLIITYVSIALCGLVVAVVPFCNTYPLLATNAAIFGLGMAAFISLSSIVICDRMGLEKLTNAFGLMSMVRGIAGMAGPPLAGFLYDATGDYDLSFYIGGLLLFVGAACHCLLHLPCLKQDPKVTNTTVEAPPDEILELIGSKPQIITVDEALSAV
ncbi:monocarboxylate transporter 5-like isoform X1 [Physella acuta]|uniref:monocarboxylate transporter 5-like isoform X1 n=2 Tax=Physella acuta TaxID=109671 RepID=UPI0027DAFE68|nr:monocarboxylate transporter 5-like isoform X1 [Physella acuta]